MSNPRVAILISGSGTNLQSFIDRAARGDLEASIALVLSNRADAYGLERARAADIPTAIISHKDFDSREDFDRAMAERIDAENIDYIVLAGFMRILSGWFVDKYRGRLLNVHPALLPLYPGLDTHQRVLDAGDTHHGTTVHFVIEDLDRGPSILQGRIPVAPSTEANDLNRRIQSVEHKIYPEALNWLASGKVRFDAGHAVLDGSVLETPVIFDYDAAGTRSEKLVCAD